MVGYSFMAWYAFANDLVYTALIYTAIGNNGNCESP